MKKLVNITFTFLVFSQLGISQFLGGPGDGFNKAMFTNSINIFAGGELDGYNPAFYKNSISIFSGGEMDGYNPASYTNTISIFSGGVYDGHSVGVKVLTFVWTGNVGSGWNLKENWQDQVIPNINSTVIIPNTALNYPAINAGIMSVGEDLNGGTFLCKRIFILEGAEMTLRVNAFLENYREIEVQGSMVVLNSALDAVQNLNGGLITIKNGGSINFVPN